ncbi:MAG: hypothetical protein MJE77_18490, partial [Proteobacteria bacterium]|nr:hypothetical protein [Pseudomonadota bacterium]
MGGFQQKPGGIFIPPVRDRQREYARDPLHSNGVMPPRPTPTMPDKASPPKPTRAQEQDQQIAATNAVLERAWDSAQTGLDVARTALSQQSSMAGQQLAAFLGAVNHTAARLDKSRPPAQCPARLCDMAEKTSARAHELLEFAFNHGLKSRSYLERLRAAVVAFDASWKRARDTVQELAHPSTAVDDFQRGAARPDHGGRWLQGGPAGSSLKPAGPPRPVTYAASKPAASTPTPTSATSKAAGVVQRKPQAQAASVEIDAAVDRIVERIDGITGDDEEQEILATLRALTPQQYGQVMARMSQRRDGTDTYLARLHQDLHGNELHTWLALDRAKRLAARAGSPEQMEATLREMEAGRGIATQDYAPSHITAPSTWSYRSYPEDASYRAGHIGVYWRKHRGWHDVTGTRSGHTLALDEFLRVNNRVTGKTEVLSAAQVVALSDDHRASAQFAELTLITLAMGGALVGTSKTLLGKVATGLFEIV